MLLDTDNQRVIIHVKDVNDEPPYFINRPLPMQAVVQLNAPPNTPIFTLQARDPDTDHSIHYFIVRDRSTYPTIVSIKILENIRKTCPLIRRNFFLLFYNFHDKITSEQILSILFTLLILIFF